ncbi:MAG: hypothetical protein AB2556_21230, partial [Candidatus Thiodiazotropha sp.]
MAGLEEGPVLERTKLVVLWREFVVALVDERVVRLVRQGSVFFCCVATDRKRSGQVWYNTCKCTIACISSIGSSTFGLLDTVAQHTLGYLFVQMEIRATRKRSSRPYFLPLPLAMYSTALRLFYFPFEDQAGRLSKLLARL